MTHYTERTIREIEEANEAADCCRDCGEDLNGADGDLCGGHFCLDELEGHASLLEELEAEQAADAEYQAFRNADWARHEALNRLPGMMLSDEQRADSWLEGF